MVTHTFGKKAMQRRTDQSQTIFDERLGDAAGGMAFTSLLTGRDCR
jgi:hypothetical protein